MIDASTYFILIVKLIFFFIRKAKPVEKLETTYRAFLRRSTRKKEHEVHYFKPLQYFYQASTLHQMILFIFSNRMIQQVRISQFVDSVAT
jgi:predicted nucleotidyltransferase